MPPKRGNQWEFIPTATSSTSTNLSQILKVSKKNYMHNYTNLRFRNGLITNLEPSERVRRAKKLSNQQQRPYLNIPYQILQAEYYRDV
jgi:ribosomal protein S2